MELMLKLFKTLANRTRLRMIEILLKKSNLCAEDIARNLDIPRATACRNLKFLERVELITGDRRDVIVYYSLNRRKDRPYNQVLIDLIKKKLAIKA